MIFFISSRVFDKIKDNMWKDEYGKVYTEEDLFNLALEECHSEESAYEYIDNLINEMELEEI
ncbi:hypothetical protein [Spiroplasma endosymbiont of Sarcophaga carnaria]|uniref:hypothetical protein n=1 Tax=Spiroplasma endosymbiont of Sarcophaga carnaria TaxID=3066303 RepID=UPI0030CB6C4E